MNVMTINSQARRPENGRKLRTTMQRIKIQQAYGYIKVGGIRDMLSVGMSMLLPMLSSVARHIESHT